MIAAEVSVKADFYLFCFADTNVKAFLQNLTFGIRIKENMAHVRMVVMVWVWKGSCVGC